MAVTDFNYTKPSSSTVLLTTGATERNSTLNIHDLSGNVFEWTLEDVMNTNKSGVYRGGSYLR